MKKEEKIKRISNIATLPAVLRAEDISQLLGISIPKVYEMMRLPGFPVCRVGKRKLVGRDRFLDWGAECSDDENTRQLMRDFRKSFTSKEDIAS